MKLCAALVILVAVGGCSTIGSTSAAISDEARDTAEFMLCRGITVGAWTRAYGNDASKAQA